MDDPTHLFEDHRPHLFGVAYRLLGSAADAEDLVQETWLRFSGAGPETLAAPRAWLVTVVTRLGLDVLRSARVARERYVGPWLPEPVPTERLAPPGPGEVLGRRETSSQAFLWMLERLGPVERAVLVLHDAFDYRHAEIGRILGRSEAASRQALHRARRQVAAARDAEGLRPTAPAGPRQRQLTEQFLAATGGADPAHLLALLAEDVVMVSDGGGKASAARRPITGRDRVTRLLTSIAAKAPAERLDWLDVNGAPALRVQRAGRASLLLVLDLDEAGRVTAIFAHRNPDKLAGL